MNDNAIDFRKHLLICGKTEEERKKQLNDILDSCPLEIFRFPKAMISLNEYLTFVQSEGLYSPFYETKGKYNLNQIFDFHLDWITENNCLFVFEEFDKADHKFSSEIFRIMINTLEKARKSAVKIIGSFEDESELIRNLNEAVNETPYKTQSEVVKSNLQIIYL
ncbi:hypothetical protein [Chryseobacterium hagamense]|uniref:AAA domain-containing protein n=1 Tax=Chryseobacterium hagamense TaxID=395935 RepID=A0A511YKE8_9FLAO|nr:hypothetical protein [Chryseobacterium hagamense]GEN75679.1 hypothetical protein CHA01nite_14190 [Chryseobacterium hagamense]